MKSPQTITIEATADVLLPDPTTPPSQFLAKDMPKPKTQLRPIIAKNFFFETGTLFNCQYSCTTTRGDFDFVFIIQFNCAFSNKKQNTIHDTNFVSTFSSNLVARTITKKKLFQFA